MISLCQFFFGKDFRIQHCRDQDDFFGALSLFRNSQSTGMTLIAFGNRATIEEVRNPALWEKIHKEYGSGD